MTERGRRTNMTLAELEVSRRFISVAELFDTIELVITTRNQMAERCRLASLTEDMKAFARVYDRPGVEEAAMADVIGKAAKAV